MNIRSLSCLVLLGFFTSVNGVYAKKSVEQNDQQWLNSNIATANNYIVPAYQNLESKANDLVTTLKSQCKGQQETSVNKTTQRRFKAVFLAWSEVEHLKFGPITFLKRGERFHYWPDKHLTGARQLKRLLASMDKSQQALSLKALKGKSVAVQGLDALERLLFSKDNALTKNECLLAKTIAYNLQQISRQVSQNWSSSPVEFAKEFELADKGRGSYSSTQEVSTLLAHALSTQLLVIAEYKVARSLPKDKKHKPKKRELEAWRSGLSLASIKHSLQSLHRLYKVAFQKTVEPKLNKKINTKFKKLIKHVKKTPALNELLKTDQGRQTIRDLQQQVHDLETLLREDLFAPLGFVNRFNSMDGD